MTRQYNPFINPATGALECLYAACGREIPPDHYLCRRHYSMLAENQVEPCPGEGCGRFKSSDYYLCTNCAMLIQPESEPSWDAGDEEAAEFFAYLLVSAAGEWYAGHTRNLRNRVWWHGTNRCKSTEGKDFGLVWFDTFPTRAEAADRELDLKRLIATRPYAVLDLVFAFQDRIGLVQPFPAPTGC